MEDFMQSVELLEDSFGLKVGRGVCQVLILSKLEAEVGLGRIGGLGTQ